MSQEIVYTSAPAGLKPGSRGFCTVVATRGMAKNLADHLEDLSGYRHLTAADEGKAGINPVAYSHFKTTVGGKTFHVLSRICDAGLDYTQRTNKLAHHVALDPQEIPPGGPAALLAAPGFMTTAWSGEPRVREAGPVVPRIDSPPAVCQSWQRLTGDAGWGGIVAAELAGDSRRPIVLVYRAGTDVLPLIVETLALLPAAKRRQATFSTYVTKLPPTIDCRWRCYVEGTPEADAAVRQAGALILDLRRPLGSSVDSPYVEAARTGRPPHVMPAGTSIESALSASEDALIAALLEDDDVAPAASVPTGAMPGRTQEAFGIAPPPVRVGFNPRSRSESQGPMSRGRFTPVVLTLICSTMLLLIIGVGFAINHRFADKTENATVEQPTAQVLKANASTVPSEKLSSSDAMAKPGLDGSDGRSQGKSSHEAKPAPAATEHKSSPTSDAPNSVVTPSRTETGAPPNSGDSRKKTDTPPNTIESRPTPSPSGSAVQSDSISVRTYHYAIKPPIRGVDKNPLADGESKPKNDIPASLRPDQMSIVLFRDSLADGSVITVNENKSTLTLSLKKDSADLATEVRLAWFRFDSQGLDWKGLDPLASADVFSALSHSVLIARQSSKPFEQHVILLREPLKVNPLPVALDGKPLEITTDFAMKVDNPLSDFERKVELDGPAKSTEYRTGHTDTLYVPYGASSVCPISLQFVYVFPKNFKISTRVNAKDPRFDTDVSNDFPDTQPLVTSGTIRLKISALSNQVAAERQALTTAQMEKPKNPAEKGAKEQKITSLQDSLSKSTAHLQKLEDLVAVVSKIEQSKLRLTLSIRLPGITTTVPIVTTKH